MSAIQEAISKLSRGEALDAALMARVADELLAGETTDAQIGAFLASLSIRGVTAEHLAAFASKMREHATPVFINDTKSLVDTCGTGGDHSGTFNISTTAALIAAGAGVRVAKHGNRAITGKCGSADVLAALDVNIEASPETCAMCLTDAGVAFFFAPVFHQAMRHVGPARKEIGIRTIFNMLGPLANPAGAARQLIGVYDPDLTEVFAKVLIDTGSEHVMIVHGADGLDEITTTAETQITEATPDAKRTYTISPEQFGFRRAKPEDLIGGEDAKANAAIVRAILAGETGPRADIAILNAAAAILVADLSQNLEEGVEKAREAIGSGAAETALAELVSVSHADTE